MHMVKGGRDQPKISNDVVLVSKNGTKHAVAFVVEKQVSSFTYAGKLWVLDQALCAHLKARAFGEVDYATCDEMVRNANVVLDLAAQFRAQLDSLKGPQQ